MSSDTPFLSIILPTYNRLYSAKAIFLPGLEQQTFRDYQLLIVDDSSTDQTEEYFTGQQFARDFPITAKRTSYRKNSHNLGAPASRNIGAQQATGEWVYIVEDDVEIKDTKFLEKAVAIMYCQPENVAVVSPKRAEGDSSPYYNHPSRTFVRIGWISAEVYLDPAQEYSDFVPNTHASSFIRRKVFLNHLEDTRLFYGNTFRDESDLYLRITRSGYRIWYCANQIKTTHRNDLAKSGGQKKVRSLSTTKQELMIWRNHYLYLKKNYNLVPIRIFFFIVGVRGVKHLANTIRVPQLKNLSSWLRI